MMTHQAITSTARPLALVTGASSGIGADLARELARHGHDLVLVGRRPAPLQALATELTAVGATSRVVTCDLSVEGAAARLVSELDAAGCLLDVAVSNAGFGDNHDFAKSDLVRDSEMMQLNMVALTQLSRLVLPGMIGRGRGRVMLVASVGGFLPGPGAALYHATKAFVISLGQALAYELRGTGVTTTTLCPGPTRTRYAEAAGAVNAQIFQGRNVMSSPDVARIAYAALASGRPLVVPGFANKLNAFLMRILPRATLLRIAARLNGVAAPTLAATPPTRHTLQ